MIFVVDAKHRRHFATDLTDMHCHRKAAFVDHAGWRIPVVADQEIDRYDLLEDTTYLLAKNGPYGPVLASARLLTTTGPHLMLALYSASYRAALPAGPTTWEVSRFCIAPGIRSRSKRLGLLWETICGVMETALLHGVNQVIFAANHSLLPLALECGWKARTVGLTINDGADEFTPVVASITQDGLRNVRDRYRIPAGVVRIPGDSKSGDTNDRLDLPTIGVPKHLSAS